MNKFYWSALILSILVESCSFTQKVRTGLQAYEVKQYAVASQLFQQEYSASRNPADKAKLAFLAGESFSKLNDQSQAGDWYGTASKEGYGNEALEHQADALKRQERYKEAIDVYNKLLQSSPGNASYRAAITTCKQAQDWQQHPEQGTAVTMLDLNTSANEYAAVPIGPSQILFTSDRDSKHTQETYLWTGRAFSDLYTWNRLTRRIEEFDSKINSPDNEGTAVLSPDGNMLVFTRCFVDDAYDAWCKLMYSFRRGDQWSEPEAFSFVQEKANYGHPAFAANGTTIFFSSDMQGGQGGHDIYYTQTDGQGGWTAPQNLGSMINTMGEEEYPTVYNDTLYYSSDHLAGLGGLDIFKTYIDLKGNWVSPINLRAPINSGGDDFGFAVDTFTKKDMHTIRQGYFTSSRGGSGKGDDLFYFSMESDTTPAVVQTDQTKVLEAPIVNYEVYINIRVKEPVHEIPEDPNSRIVENRTLPNGPIVISDGLTDRRLVTDELGQLLIKLELNKEYTFTARYRDHLSRSFTLNTGTLEKNPDQPITTINQLLILDPIFKNKEIVLENIFYDYDEWVIRNDAKPSLNNLSVILKTNPNIKIQLTSHTDCRGTEEYNLDLSQKRAQAAIDYLKSVGIPEARLVAVGMGESSPAVNCECDKCTEEQHQTNRRTTFKIID